MGTSLPNLQRQDKEELQSIFGVLQKPSLEAMVCGRYNIPFEFKTAADQMIVKQGTYDNQLYHGYFEWIYVLFCRSNHWKSSGDPPRLAIGKPFLTTTARVGGQVMDQSFKSSPIGWEDDVRCCKIDVIPEHQEDQFRKCV